MAEYLSPTGSPIVAAFERTPCAAGISGIDPETGEPEYDGSGSDMFWDDQEPCMRDGKRLFIDDDGEKWTFDQLALAPDQEDEDEANG